MRIFLILLTIILTHNIAFADAYIAPRFQSQVQRSLFVKKFQLYASPFTEANAYPLRKYCNLPTDKAELYLKTKQEIAQSDALAAYHYGMLIGFAPCLSQETKEASNYLLVAARDGIDDASYLLGLILLKQDNISTAKSYFMYAAKNDHAQASYNYALLSSGNFTVLNNATLDLLKNAAVSGDLKIQHDTIIVALKLFLNKKITLKNTEMIRIENILSAIIEKTHNNHLKEIAVNNLNYLTELKTQSLMNSQADVINSNDTARIQSHMKSIDTAQIDFDAFEEQAIKTFEDYRRF